MRGVILAGGHGKRLHPLTLVTNKHLLPVYKKPMIYYPIETLVDAGIKEILIVTSGEHLGDFFKLLRTGQQWGITIQYQIQEGSEGTGVALLCAEEFAKDGDFMVILGDNIITESITRFVDEFEAEKGTFDAKILVTRVKNPEKYGVVELDGPRVTRLVEKPDVPFSDCINTGLWLFKPEVFSLCHQLKKSKRNEYEATDVLHAYATAGRLSYGMLESQWTDAGTFEQLYSAAILMKELEDKKSMAVDSMAGVMG